MSSVRIITEELGGSPLSLRIQHGDVPAKWMPARPRSTDQWRSRATDRSNERDWSAMWDALAPALAATGPAAERLKRVRDNRGIVVTTGQQPGLFGGPVYTWSKAVSALALADTIERVTGIPCAAVFWAATDDADFAEAASTTLAVIGGADVLTSTDAPPAGTPMSLAPLGDCSALLARLAAASGSAADQLALEVATRAYGDANGSIGSAYVALLRELLAPLGIPVLDASHDAVRHASDAVLRSALRCSGDIEKSLLARRGELVAEGYEPQVEDMAGLTPVFVREGSIKRRLSIVEAGDVAADPDAMLTPNVLLRPIVEAAILPTVAYLGGPGELTYFAQVSAVSQAMSLSAPLAVPRWSCTLIEPHVQELLARFDVSPNDLVEPHGLERMVATRSMSEETAASLASVRSAIEMLPAEIAAETDGLGLQAAVQGAKQSLLHRMDRLERRVLARIKHREYEQFRDVATLRAALYPRGIRQERAMNIVPLLSRHGSALLAEMCHAAQPHAERLVGVAS